MWLRCGVDEWHLDCRIGGEVSLNCNKVTSKDHDFIAAVRRDDGRLKFSISSCTKVFDSNKALNSYLKAIGLEEICLPQPID